MVDGRLDELTHSLRGCSGALGDNDGKGTKVLLHARESIHNGRFTITIQIQRLHVHAFAYVETIIKYHRQVRHKVAFFLQLLQADQPKFVPCSLQNNEMMWKELDIERMIRRLKTTYLSDTNEIQHATPYQSHTRGLATHRCDNLH